VSLDYLDLFCDGTAVRKAGLLTHHYCSQLVDRFVTVTNDEVCGAIQWLWNARRQIAEPAGAMGLAAWLKDGGFSDRKSALVVVGGANMDFGQLSWVVKRAAIGSATRRHYRFFIEECPGSLLRLLGFFPPELNVVEFQHGAVSEREAAPVIGVDASARLLRDLERRWTDSGIRFEDATSDPDVEFRVIHYDPSTFSNPVWMRAEFHERPGALGEFLRRHCTHASIVYFNYGYTGERVGRALMAFDFADATLRDAFLWSVQQPDSSLRHVASMDQRSFARLQGLRGSAVG
jgi:threonine dehydratase